MRACNLADDVAMLTAAWSQLLAQRTPSKKLNYAALASLPSLFQAAAAPAIVGLPAAGSRDGPLVRVQGVAGHMGGAAALAPPVGASGVLPLVARTPSLIGASECERLLRVLCEKPRHTPRFSRVVTRWRTCRRRGARKASRCAYSAPTRSEAGRSRCAER